MQPDRNEPDEVDNHQLPTDIKNRVPPAKLTVYQKAYDKGLKEGMSREQAHRFAWAKLRRVAPEVFLRERESTEYPVSWRH